jgi:hypothetical protein
MRNPLKTMALTASMLLMLVSTAAAQVSIGIQIGPPPPPIVARVPPPPAVGYMWVPGYWYPAGPHYRWYNGYWARPPYGGAYWVAPRYSGNRYYNGYWAGNRGRAYGSSRYYSRR